MSLIQKALDNARTLIRVRDDIDGDLMYMSRYAIQSVPPEVLERFMEEVSLGNESCVGLWVIRADINAAINRSLRLSDGYTTPLGAIRGTFQEACLTALLLDYVVTIFELPDYQAQHHGHLFEVEFIPDATDSNAVFHDVAMTLDEFRNSRVQLEQSAFELDFEHFRNTDTTVWQYGPKDCEVCVILDHDLGDYIVHYGDQRFASADEVGIIMIAFLIYLTSIGELHDSEGIRAIHLIQK